MSDDGWASTTTTTTIMPRHPDTLDPPKVQALERTLTHHRQQPTQVPELVVAHVQVHEASQAHQGLQVLEVIVGQG